MGGVDRMEAEDESSAFDEEGAQKGGARPGHLVIRDYLKRLDDMVDTLKARGFTKANRSALIRYALSEVDLESVPKGI